MLRHFTYAKKQLQRFRFVNVVAYCWLESQWFYCCLFCLFIFVVPCVYVCVNAEWVSLVIVIVVVVVFFFISKNICCFRIFLGKIARRHHVSVSLYKIQNSICIHCIYVCCMYHASLEHGHKKREERQWDFFPFSLVRSLRGTCMYVRVLFSMLSVDFAFTGRARLCIHVYYSALFAVLADVTATAVVVVFVVVVSGYSDFFLLFLHWQSLTRLINNSAVLWFSYPIST